MESNGNGNGDMGFQPKLRTIGKKIKLGGKYVGQKTIEGTRWMGNKIWENKGKILGAVLAAASAGVFGDTTKAYTRIGQSVAADPRGSAIAAAPSAWRIATESDPSKQLPRGHPHYGL